MIIHNMTRKFLCCLILIGLLCPLGLARETEAADSDSLYNELQIVKEPRNTMKAILSVLEEKGVLDETEVVGKIEKMDPAASDTTQTRFGFQNIRQYDGYKIAMSGIFVVFMGLVLIALTIHVFNKEFQRAEHKKALAIASEAAGEPVKELPQPDREPIPEDVLAAIAVAVECYRRIHFDSLDSQVTFRRGEQQSSWKTGVKYGQRI